MLARVIGNDGGVIGQSAGALAPALVVGLIGFGVMAARRGGHAAGAHAWIAPLTLGLAVIASHPVIHGWHAPWRSAEQVIPIAALGAMTMGVLAERVRFGVVVRWAVRAAVLGVLLAIALRRVWACAGVLESALEIGVMVALALCAWAALERVVDRAGGTPNAACARGAGGPVVIMVYTCCAAGVCVLTGSHSLALSSASIAVAIAPCAALALARPRTSIAMGGAHVPALVIPFVLALHLTLGAEPAHAARVSALLVLAVPIAASAADWPCVCEAGGGRRTAARLALAIATGAAAVSVAASGFTPA